MPVAIVTGSSSGIGEATAVRFAREGYGVVVNGARRAGEAERVAARIRGEGGRAAVVVGDVARRETADALVAAAVDELGGLDVLVNNAAYLVEVPFADLEALDEETWDRSMAVNLRGPWLCARAAAGPLRAGGGGHIVNVASLAGVLGAGSNLAYAISKAGLIHLTRCLARALAPEIRVNTVSPGHVETESNSHRREVGEARRLQSPLRENPTPEDVAAVILAVVEGMPKVTGRNILVDSGLAP